MPKNLTCDELQVIQICKEVDQCGTPLSGSPRVLDWLYGNGYIDTPSEKPGTWTVSPDGRALLQRIQG